MIEMNETTAIDLNVLCRYCGKPRHECGCGTTAGAMYNYSSIETHQLKGD